MTYTVTVYMTDRAYGGPEEGGWYFDVGHPVKIPEVRNRRFKRLDKARGYLNKVRAQLDRLNRERYPIDSVLSDGAYAAFISSDKPKPYPSLRPHYE